jgi:hypothetical protein
MRLFSCCRCGNTLYFENTQCVKCDAVLGFDAQNMSMLALAPDADGTTFTAIAADAPSEDQGKWRYCENVTHAACNWVLPAESNETLCLNCRHNGMIPNLQSPNQLLLWQRVEMAKHRLFYSILKLQLPTGQGHDPSDERLIFDVLADDAGSDSPPVMTGHDAGRISLALAEADDAERERRRAMFGEPYRTLLGHLRHEVGHYYWDVLVRETASLEVFRVLFGDETADYQQALKTYYDLGPAPDWSENHVSAYASAHPWEDFAETFAHYLHIVDTLEMAVNFGIHLRPNIRSPDGHAMAASVTQEPLETNNFDDILRDWLPITTMANNLNRCMGSADTYPFMLNLKACEKLRFVHELIVPRPG